MNLSKTVIVLALCTLCKSALGEPPVSEPQPAQSSPPHTVETDEESTQDPQPDPVRQVRTRATIATELMRRGDQALRQDRIRDACKAYSQAHTTLPSWWMPRLAIVRCGRVIGLPIKTLLAHAAFAVKARPQIALTHLEYGAVLEESGRNAEAARAYQAALRMDANRIDARRRLGVVLSELGKFPAAQRHLKQVLRVRPREMRVLLALATAYEGTGNLGDAEKTYRKLSQLSRYPAEAMARLIQFFDRHGMKKKSARLKKQFQSRYLLKK